MAVTALDPATRATIETLIRAEESGREKVLGKEELFRAILATEDPDPQIQAAVTRMGDALLRESEEQLRVALAALPCFEKM